MHNKRAFTIVELLIVVAIIAVLVAIAIPVISGPREKVRTVTCETNLRQIALAVQQYVADNDGCYPIVMYGAPGPTSLRTSLQCQDAIYPYARDGRIFHCPDYPSDGRGEFGEHAKPPKPLATVDYDYDMMRLNFLRPPFPTKTIFGSSDASLGTQATIWLNTDGGWSEGDDLYYARKVTSSCGRTFFGGTLHSGGANYSYVAAM